MSCHSYLQRDRSIHKFIHMYSSDTETRATHVKSSHCIHSTTKLSLHNVFKLPFNSLNSVTFLFLLIVSVKSNDELKSLSPFPSSLLESSASVSQSHNNHNNSSSSMSNSNSNILSSSINNSSASQVPSPSHKASSSKRVKCDFVKFPSTGCPDRSVCNKDTDNCECSSAKYPFKIDGLCVGYVGYNDPCVSSKQCLKGSCLDSDGQEVTFSSFISISRASASSHPIYPSIGTCRCSDNFFYSLEKGECVRKVLGRRCTFHTECFHRSHAYCDGSKCKCKHEFVHDSSSDECRPSQWSLCVFHPNGTRNCGEYVNDSNVAGGSIVSGGAFIPGSVPTSLSALFWPIIAFFLVILLLKMLKEGMRRDCDPIGTMNSDVPYNNVHGHRGGGFTGAGHAHSSGHNRNRARSHNGHRHHHHHHRHHHGHSSIRTPFVPSPVFSGEHFTSPTASIAASGSVMTPLTCDVSNGEVPLTASNNRDSSSAAPHEIIVLMPPPPYSVSPNTPSNEQIVNNSIVTSAVLEEPPSYEEATRK